MRRASTSDPNSLGFWLIPIAISLILLPTSWISMALFHSLIELIAIGVAVMSFVVAWHTYPLSRNSVLLYLGCGYFWVGIIDLLHTLTFEDVVVIPGVAPGTTIELWITARYLEAGILISAPFVHFHRYSPLRVMALLGMTSSLGLLACFTHQIPPMFIPGHGLTPVKVISEYVIITLLFMAALLFILRRHRLNAHNIRLILISIVFTILAELCFTLYIGLKEMPIVIGHLFKLFSFWVIYQLLVESSLTRPVNSLAQIVDSYDAATDETAIIDQQGRIQRANLALRNRLDEGYERTHCHAVMHSTTLSPTECPLCQAIRERTTLQAYEFFDPEQDNWYEFNLSGIHYSEHYSALIHSRRCINSRKRAEHQARSLNRLYQVLSHTNKAIVATQHREALFQRICDIAVTYGEFTMAWIGIIEGSHVRPDFCAGEETGYLKTMQMRVDDSAWAQGPVGKAAKSAQVAWVNDVLTDEDFWPWREAASQRGYRALAAVPIKEAGAVIGLFTLYSSQEGVFDEPMRALLASLSDDLSAALNHFTQARMKVEAESTIRQLSSAIEQGAHAVIIANAQGTIEYVNTQFVEQTGYANVEFVGQPAHQLKQLFCDANQYRDIEAACDTGRSWQGEVLNNKKNHTTFWALLSVSPIRDDTGTITHTLYNFTDNSELHAAQETIAQLAFYDALTGLANRRLLMDRLEHALASAHRHGELVAVMLSDLDNFKHINDSLGHDAGDQLLQHIASLLKASVRADDTVARLGGDEFVVVLDGIQEATQIAAIADTILRALESPLTLLGHPVAVSSSIGIALYPQDGDSPSQLLRSADLAMYHAKSEGKNRYQFYRQEMHAQAQARLNPPGALPDVPNT